MKRKTFPTAVPPLLSAASPHTTSGAPEKRGVSCALGQELPVLPELLPPTEWKMGELISERLPGPHFHSNHSGLKKQQRGSARAVKHVQKAGWERAGVVDGSRSLKSW